MGAGVIIRDSLEVAITMRSLTIQTKQEPVIGEAMWALYVTEFGQDIEVQDVILEGIL